MNDPQPTQTSAGRPATRGSCPDCGAVLTQPGGHITPARATRQVISAPPVTRRVATLARTRQPKVARAAIQPPPIQLMEEDIAAILPMTPAEWANLAGRSDEEITTPPLTIIKGIGPAYALSLDQLGFGTMANLAEAEPEAVAAGVSGISPKQAGDLIAAAKQQMILADARRAPLVSCVMPTYNRRPFVPKAIEYFLRQDYPHRELIIVDDGTDPVADLVPENDHIHYVQLEERFTIGAKMNIGCEVAGGNILVRWEDDVWMDYWRLSYQAAALLKHGADLCGPNNYLHYDVLKQVAWHSTQFLSTQPWILGSTLCFTRAIWERNPFPDMNLGDEIRFVRSDPSAKIFNLQAVTFLIDIIHGQNTAPKNTSSERWHEFPVKDIKGLMGSDWSFYQELSQL